jgi:hypothetical protein
MHGHIFVLARLLSQGAGFGAPIIGRFAGARAGACRLGSVRWVARFGPGQARSCLLWTEAPIAVILTA